MKFYEAVNSKSAIEKYFEHYKVMQFLSRASWNSKEKNSQDPRKRFLSTEAKISETILIENRELESTITNHENRNKIPEISHRKIKTRKPESEILNVYAEVNYFSRTGGTISNLE